MEAVFFLLVWYAIGVVLFWATCVRIDPVFRRSDIGPTLIAGVMGPVLLLWLVFYWNSNSGPRDEKIEWLSLNRPTR